MYNQLRLILGDQLNAQHSWFKTPVESTLYVLMECRSEATYVRHHVQKVIGFFLAMRAFADWLKSQGFKVEYLRLDDPENKQQIAANLEWIVEKYQIRRLEYQLPDEYRLDKELGTLKDRLPIPVHAVDTEHFLSSRGELNSLFEGKKQYLLETFYRFMRKKYDILMEPDGETPLTGRWNYDQENRKKLPVKQSIPEVPSFQRSVHDLARLLDEQNIETIGRLDPDNFNWPVTREEQLTQMEHFLDYRFQNFGTYQDAMTDRHYLLFHSRLSFGLNTKLLHPKEVIDAAVQYWQNHQAKISIAQVEGFVRQILGWREYMRGIYWAKMPDYKQLNYFEHTASLPQWYWNAETGMKCLQHAVDQSLDNAYAHHIQRLMITGNFALLLGVHPDALDEWYLGIYMDAIEWVELTNTRGMSQFADGGIVGTKPYVSSANYIHKMSDYCKSCTYDRKKKYGEHACPFNSLYWDFYSRHRSLLSNNPRVAMMYRIWDKMDTKEQEQLLQQADRYKKTVDKL